LKRNGLSKNGHLDASEELAAADASQHLHLLNLSGRSHDLKMLMIF
jgi:hypothetical protein